MNSQKILEKQAFTKIPLISSTISVGSYQNMLEHILNLASASISSSVCFANVHMLWEASKDHTLRVALERASLVCPDGKPVSLLMRLTYGIRQERVCGMDIMPDLLKACAKRGISVFFYGSTEDVLDKLTHKAIKLNPELLVAGSYSPPFRPLSQKEDEEVVERIRLSGAQIVLVSLGCPKQEKWMSDHLQRINACMLGLGQAFLTYTGDEKRLPLWARNLSLEWAYRLYLEPQRLWKRYLFGNSWFLFQFPKTILKAKFFPKLGK